MSARLLEWGLVGPSPLSTRVRSLLLERFARNSVPHQHRGGPPVRSDMSDRPTRPPCTASQPATRRVDARRRRPERARRRSRTSRASVVALARASAPRPAGDGRPPKDPRRRPEREDASPRRGGRAGGHIRGRRNGAASEKTDAARQQRGARGTRTIAKVRRGRPPAWWGVGVARGLTKTKNKTTNEKKNPPRRLPRSLMTAEGSSRHRAPRRP